MQGLFRLPGWTHDDGIGTSQTVVLLYIGTLLRHDPRPTAVGIEVVVIQVYVGASVQA